MLPRVHFTQWKHSLVQLVTSWHILQNGEVKVVFFMEEVQKYDCIYNKYSKSYKDKYIKMNC